MMRVDEVKTLNTCQKNLDEGYSDFGCKKL